MGNSWILSCIAHHLRMSWMEAEEWRIVLGVEFDVVVFE